jgi:hypothetical protein
VNAQIQKQIKKIEKDKIEKEEAPKFIFNKELTSK